MLCIILPTHYNNVLLISRSFCLLSNEHKACIKVFCDCTDVSRFLTYFFLPAYFHKQWEIYVFSLQDSVNDSNFNLRISCFIFEETLFCLFCYNRRFKLSWILYLRAKIKSCGRKELAHTLVIDYNRFYSLKVLAHFSSGIIGRFLHVPTSQIYCLTGAIIARHI